VISLRVAVALAVLIVGLSTLFSAAAAPALGQSPSPAPTILLDPLDPRGGPAAGGSGSPLLALLAVVGAGVLAAAATAVYVKATRRS
jgi:hypothetical protein